MVEGWFVDLFLFFFFSRCCREDQSNCRVMGWDMLGLSLILLSIFFWFCFRLTEEAVSSFWWWCYTSFCSTGRDLGYLSWWGRQAWIWTKYQGLDRRQAFHKRSWRWSWGVLFWLSFFSILCLFLGLRSWFDRWLRGQFDFWLVFWLCLL